MRFPNLRFDRNQGLLSSVVYIWTLGTSATAAEMLLCRSVVIAILFDLVSLSRATRTAYVEIVVCDSNDERSMYTDKLQGTFANIGTLSRAKGDVLQVGFQDL